MWWDRAPFSLLPWAGGVGGWVLVCREVSALQGSPPLLNHQTNGWLTGWAVQGVLVHFTDEATESGERPPCGAGTRGAAPAWAEPVRPGTAAPR